MKDYDCSREPMMSDVSPISEDKDYQIHHSIQLTDREMAIAKVAAKIAVREVSDEFYRQVGKGLVTRILVWIGLVFVGFAMARGWITFPQ
jgi:hypothetical protein